MTGLECIFLALVRLLPLALATRNVRIHQPQTPSSDINTAFLDALEGRGDGVPSRQLLQSTDNYIEVGSEMCVNFDLTGAAGAQAEPSSSMSQVQCEDACTSNTMSSPERTCFGFAYGIPPNPPPFPPRNPPVRSPPPLLLPPSPPPSPPPAANSPRTPSTHAGVGVNLPPLPPGYADFLRGYPRVTVSAPGTAVLAVRTTEAVIVQWMLTRADADEVSAVNLQLPQQVPFSLQYGTIQVFASNQEATANLNNLQCTQCRVTLIAKDSSLNFGYVWDVYFANSATRRRLLRAEDAGLELPSITKTTFAELSAEQTSTGRRRNLLQTVNTRCFLMLSTPTDTATSAFSNAKCYAKKVSPPPPPAPPPQPLYPPKAPGCDSNTEIITTVDFKLYGTDGKYIPLEFSPAFDRSIHFYRATVQHDSVRIAAEAALSFANMVNLTFRDELQPTIGSSGSLQSAASVNLNGPGLETTFLLVSRSLRGGAECPYTFKVTQLPEPPPPPYVTPPPSPPPKPPLSPGRPPSAPLSPPFPPELPTPPLPALPAPPPPPAPPPALSETNPSPPPPSPGGGAAQARDSGGITESDLKAFGDDAGAAFADSPYYASIVLAVIVFAVGSYFVVTGCMVVEEAAPGSYGYDDRGIPLAKPPSRDNFRKYLVWFPASLFRRSRTSPMGNHEHSSPGSQGANIRKTPVAKKKDFVSPTRRPADTGNDSNSNQNDDPLLNKDLPPLYPTGNLDGEDVPSSMSGTKLGPNTPSLFGNRNTTYVVEPDLEAGEESRPSVVNGEETDVSKSAGQQKQKEDVLMGSFSYSVDGEDEEIADPKQSQNMPPRKSKHNSYAAIHPSE